MGCTENQIQIITAFQTYLRLCEGKYCIPLLVLFYLEILSRLHLRNQLRQSRLYTLNSLYYTSERKIGDLT